MTNTIFIDFETRSKCDITKAGAWRYSQDPTTDVMCMAYAIDDGPAQLWVPSHFDLPADYEETRTKDLHHKINLAEKRKEKYSKEQGKDELYEKAVEEIKFFKSLLDDNGEFKLSFTYHTDVPAFITDRKVFEDVGGLLEAHNASFEQAIWANVLVPKYGAFEAPPIIWRDSMAMCAAHNIPLSLEKAGAALNVDKQKDLEGKRVMLQLSQPRKPSASNPKEWWEPTEAADKFETVFMYCMDDVETERAIGKALNPLTKKEQWVWLLDQMVNQRGVQIDVDLVYRCLDIIKEHTEAGKRRITELTNGEVTNVSLVAKLKDWVISQGVKVEDMTKASVEALLADKDTPENVREAMLIRQSLSKASTKKLDTMLFAKAINDNRIRYTLLYHGASTGRWAGRLIQVQNFPRGSIKDIDQAVQDLFDLSLEELQDKYGDVMEVISSCLRAMIVPDKGHDFIVADYGAIEARVVMWYADEQDALQKFRDGVDLYKDMAGYVYDKPLEEVDDSEERQLGKSIILGCFEEDTPVLTNSGVKRIIDVHDTDLLWDGIEWVKHQGLQYQGIKETKRTYGIGATLDHEILVDGTWQEWNEVTTNPSLFQKALNLENLPSSAGNENTINEDALKASTLSVIVPVADELILIGTPLNQEEHADAMSALRKRVQRPGKNILDMHRLYPMTDIGKDCLIESVLASADAMSKVTPITNIMEGGELESNLNGVETENYSWSILSLWKDGTNPSLNWTELMSTVDMRKEIYASALVAKTCQIEEGCLTSKNKSMNSKQRSSVYDIMNAGPRNRFTIITNHGPIIVHNCGFGMGANKFQMTTESQGLQLDEKMAAAAVKAYREKYSGVPQFWRNTEKAAIDAVKTREPQETNKTTWVFNEETNFLECLLPSGRSLYYYNPKIKIGWAVKWIDSKKKFHYDKYDSKDEALLALSGRKDDPLCTRIVDNDIHEDESLTHMGVNSVTKQFQRQETYGGKLVENVVQATARDCMVEGMFRTEKNKYLTIMTIHDEIVSEVPEGQGSVEEFESLLAQTPEWADGLPLVAEGWRGKRYRK